MLLTIVSFFLLLGLLMFFHELGHYLAARRAGIEVEEFGVFGFPPRLFTLFTYRGTKFTVNAIPFGAFVRMKGEDAGDMEPGSFNAASAGARTVVLVAGPAMNLILAVLFSVAALLSGAPAWVGHPALTQVPPETRAAQVGLQAGDILVQHRDSPIYVDPETGALWEVRLLPAERPPAVTDLQLYRDRRAQILALPDGVGPEELVEGTAYEPVLFSRIFLVAEGSPAEAAGVQVGDRIYALNGILVTPERPLSDLVQEHKGQVVTLTVLRDGQWLDIQVLARENPPPGQGSMGVGIQAVTAPVQYPLWRAVWEGAWNIVLYVRTLLALPVLLLLGEVSPNEASVSGPVGIAQLVGGAVSATAQTGFWFPVLQLAAIISAGLGVANLLPIPALDGGRLLFIAIEKLRGRRIDPEKEGMIHLIGFALLLGLMALVTISDIRSGPEAIDWTQILGQ